MTCDSKVLKKTNYISLKEIQCPEKNIEGYIYSHENRCNGHIVAILPFTFERLNLNFLLRYELTPCWDMEHNQVSSITGGVESDNPEDDALRELKEEAGYDVPKEELVDLGTCFSSKSNDTLIHLYTVNLMNYKKDEAEGDGSYLEDQAYCFWSNSIDHAVDPLVFILHYRLGRFLSQ